MFLGRRRTWAVVMVSIHIYGFHRTVCYHYTIRCIDKQDAYFTFNRCIIRVAERILIWWFRKNSNLRPLPRQGSILPLKYGTDLICSCENAHPEKEFINASAFDITERELSPLFSRPNKTCGVSGGFRDLMKWICNPLPNRSATLTSFFVRPSGLEPEKV